MALCTYLNDLTPRDFYIYLWMKAANKVKVALKTAPQEAHRLPEILITVQMI
jgi:hypothetical protein